MPDQLAILRLAALLVFIGLVAVGLWLLDVAWWVVPPVMGVALLIAWTIEWIAWRESLATTVVRETTAPPAVPWTPPMEEPVPAEAFAPAQAEPIAPPEPEPQPEPEPERAPEPPPPPPEPEPVLVPTPPPAAEPPEELIAAAPLEEGPPPKTAEPRRSRRFRLRAVPSRPEFQPEPQPESQPAAAAPAAASVVELRPRTTEPRQWNLWDLERIAREEGREHPERRDEWSYLFLNLRQFAHADGSLPTEFDGLVRESFAGMLDRPRGA